MVDWTEAQNDAIVADYFAMLADDIVGRPYSKAEHNRRLQAVIDRPRGSIEYKHQNISAVLKGLREDWLPGYRPAFNFQDFPGFSVTVHETRVLPCASRVVCTVTVILFWVTPGIRDGPCQPWGLCLRRLRVLAISALSP